MGLKAQAATRSWSCSAQGGEPRTSVAEAAAKRLVVRLQPQQRDVMLAFRVEQCCMGAGVGKERVSRHTFYKKFNLLTWDGIRCHAVVKRTQNCVCY